MKIPTILKTTLQVSLATLLHSSRRAGDEPCLCFYLHAACVSGGVDAPAYLSAPPVVQQVKVRASQPRLVCKPR